MTLVPALGLLAVVCFWRWRVVRRAERVPVADKLLRPAGESLRRRIEALDDKLTDTFLLGIFAPLGAIAAVFFALALSPPLTRLVVAFVSGVAAFAFVTRRMLAQLRELRNCRLGFHGERAVAEEINQLMRDGCRVFHDVPMEPYGNIDHVIVAPSGVYAVETKTRRKRKAPPGKKDHEVVFDGKALEFPHGADTHGLEQARQQADRLRAMLTKAVGEPVGTMAILTLPGWFVMSRVNGPLKVVNPKGIRHVVTANQPASLTPQLIERISYQLDQRCRDVEL